MINYVCQMVRQSNDSSMIYSTNRYHNKIAVVFVNILGVILVRKNLPLKNLISFFKLDLNLVFLFLGHIGQRLLFVFDQNQVCETDSIPGSLVIRIVRILWNYLTSVKAYILFKLFDKNNDDRVSIDEIRLFYQEYLSEFKIFKEKGQLTEIVDTFLKGFFPVNNNVQQQQELDFDQFYDILKQNPDVFKSLYLISVPDQDREEEKKFIWYQRCFLYMKNNSSRVIFLVLYILTLLSLIIYRVVSLENQSIWRIVARSGGILINFNFALAITLMLKQTMTIFRRIYYLRLIIPVDDHIDAHRLVGTILFISAMIHSLGHMIHFAIYTDGLYKSLSLSLTVYYIFF